MSQFSDALFIGGSGRSGTTITGKLLSRHKEVILAKLIEIKFLTSGNGLLDLYLNPRISRSGKPRVGPQANLKRFIKSADEKWWLRKGKKGGMTGLSTGAHSIAGNHYDYGLSHQRKVGAVFEQCVAFRLTRIEGHAGNPTCPLHLAFSNIFSAVNFGET